jgi:hypothetical protein
MDITRIYPNKNMLLSEIINQSKELSYIKAIEGTVTMHLFDCFAIRKEREIELEMYLIGHLRIRFFQTVVLKVAMSCQGCAGAVQRALTKMEGLLFFYLLSCVFCSLYKRNFQKSRQ